ncbi:MAG TPA: TMEM175 family protein, partial [bacterium]|nr:TMEM175 family protein [bacterium]
MKMPSVKKLHLDLSTTRIENLVDGVFAIALTILVLNLDIDEMISHGREVPFEEAIVMLWPRLLHYLESFVILAVFWTKHHQQCHFIRRSDGGMLWINLIALFFVSLIPFSTSLVGDYGDRHLAALIFEANIFAGGIIFWLHWRHASAGKRLIDKDVGYDVVAFYRRGSYVIPLASVAAMSLTIFSPRVGTMVFLFVPLVFALMRLGFSVSPAVRAGRA